MTLGPPLRDDEVTPALRAEALRILHDPEYELGDVVLLPPNCSFAAVVETHTNGTATNPAPHPHRGVTLYHAAPTVEGIDVSGYQRGADFGPVAESGRSFVYIKASEGLTLTDAAFAEHWARAGAAGLLRGAYHFFRASRSSSDQVAHFLEVIGSVDRGELPPCLDVETADHTDYPGVALAVARAVESLAAMRRRPVVYTMPGFWDALPASALGHVPELADLWVAHWGVREPMIPRGWERAKIWQYSSTASVPGVAGAMDVNRWTGTLEELRAWGAGSPGGS